MRLDLGDPYFTVVKELTAHPFVKLMTLFSNFFDNFTVGFSRVFFNLILDLTTSNWYPHRS